jgi:hypothetical protein
MKTSNWNPKLLEESQKALTDIKNVKRMEEIDNLSRKAEMDKFFNDFESKINTVGDQLSKIKFQDKVQPKQSWLNIFGL